MTQLKLKASAPLLARLGTLDDNSMLRVEIVPMPNRWNGLVRALRSERFEGVEFNVIALTSISARLPTKLLKRIAERPDVAAVRLGEGGE